MGRLLLLGNFRIKCFRACASKTFLCVEAFFVLHGSSTCPKQCPGVAVFRASACEKRFTGPDTSDVQRLNPRDQVLSRDFVASRTHVQNGCEGLRWFERHSQQEIPLANENSQLSISSLGAGTVAPGHLSAPGGCLSGPCMVSWGFSCSMCGIESPLWPSVPPQKKNALKLQT